MVEISTRTIRCGKTAKDALTQMDKLGEHLTLFVVDESNQLVGTLTDGDIRRGLLRNLNLSDAVDTFMFTGFSFLRKTFFSVKEVAEIRNKGILLVPIVDEKLQIIKIVNLSSTKTILPLDVVVMAGGEGRRLRPLTNETPKPLLKVGNKPIIEHNLDRLINFGVDDFWICIRYLGAQIVKYVGDGSNKNVSIEFIEEHEPLGTIGAVKGIKNFRHDCILVTNSDLLTDLDYEEFYTDFVTRDADLSIVTIPYRVGVPYAVLETSDGQVISFKEKPTYTYYSNGGIYLMKKGVIETIPDGVFYNATDLIEQLISNGKKVISYAHSSYWLDIGRIEDFEKAKNDINRLKL
jgi:dTDP-glucose pyrophosphorylase